MGVIVTEGVEGYWHYHLSKPETFTRSLCGKKVMRTALPLSCWGTISHLRERYCKECERLSQLLDKPTPGCAAALLSGRTRSDG